MEPTKNETSAFRYETVKTIVYSSYYVYKSLAGEDFLRIEYSIVADVVNRDDFTDCKLLNDENKDKYLRTVINLDIYNCLAPYHVIFDKDEHYRFHKIVDVNSTTLTIAENPEPTNNLISKIESKLSNSKAICGVKTTCFNLKKARKYVPLKQRFLKGDKKMKGKYVDAMEIYEADIQKYKAFSIEIVPIIYKDYFHIQWKKDSTVPSGILKIYRKEGALPKNKYDSTEAGELVVDTMENMHVYIDEGTRIKKGETYSYTVFYIEHPSGFIFKSIPEPRWITSFSLVLPPPQEQQKTRVEVFRETKEAELEEHEISLDIEHKKMLKELKAKVKSKKEGERLVEQYGRDLEKSLRDSNNGRLNKDNKKYLDNRIRDINDKLRDYFPEDE